MRVPRSALGRDHVRSVCKRCGHQIMVNDETEWQTQPLVGLVHADCVPVPSAIDNLDPGPRPTTDPCTRRSP